jgi:hypothetical protein
MYRISADRIGFAVNGVLEMDVSVGRLSTTGVHLIGDGTVALPAYAFISDPNSGMYRIADGQIGFAANGLQRLEVNTTGITVTGSVLTNAGSVALPAFAFSSDPNTGVYRIGEGRIGFSVNGVLTQEVSAGGIVVKGTIWTGAGTAALPAYAFEGDPDCGMYRWGVNTLGFAVGGAETMTLDATDAFFAPRLRAPNGSAGAPSYSFTNDPNTGFYTLVSDTIQVALGGAQTARFEATNANGTTVQTRAFADARYAPVSDAALKTNIQTMTLTGEDWVNQLRPVTFEWLETDDYAKPAGTIYGLIAQEVQALYPNATRMSDAGLALDPLVLIATLVKAVQELSAKVLALENAP